MMNTKVIENQEYLLFGILDQPAQKLYESLGIHCALVDHESNHALIGDRGNQIDSFGFGRQSYNRGFSPRCIAATMIRIIAVNGNEKCTSYGKIKVYHSQSVRGLGC